MSNETRNITRILACAVFKPAVEYLRLADRYPDLRLTYLPSHLHLRPEELKDRLQKRIAYARRRRERVICLYAYCFPNIDKFCQQHGVLKVPGDYCYEMLLSSGRFQELVDEVTGTYFVERDLILNFEEYCVTPLELYDEEMREYCFRRYQRLLYVRQPSDPDLVSLAREQAEFLGLSLEIRDADYYHLERKLVDLISPGLGGAGALAEISL